MAALDTQMTVKVNVDDTELKAYLARTPEHMLKVMIAEEVHRQVVEEVKKQIDGLFRSLKMQTGVRNAFYKDMDLPEGA